MNVQSAWLPDGVAQNSGGRRSGQILTSLSLTNVTVVISLALINCLKVTRIFPMLRIQH